MYVVTELSISKYKEKLVEHLWCCTIAHGLLKWGWMNIVMKNKDEETTLAKEMLEKFP